jgi:hypothetical protein
MVADPAEADPSVLPAPTDSVRPRRALLLDVVRTAAVLAVAAGLGLLGGWLWWRWWAPATPGRVFDTTQGPMWLPDPWGPGQEHIFSGTAQFFVVGLGLGLLLGVLAGVAAGRRAVAGLVALVVSSVVAALVMRWFGLGFSPPDPATLVDAHAVGDELPGHLALTGWTPYLAWPIGAVFGYFCVMLAASARSSLRKRAVDDGTWRDPGTPRT